MTQQQQRHKADNKIRVEGARALGEALNANTTLVSLNLDSVQQQQWKCQTTTQQQRHKTGNKIGVEGAHALSEALKVNTTLQTLHLQCVQQQQQQDNSKQ